MSIQKDPLWKIKRYSKGTQQEKTLISKIEEYLKNISVEQVYDGPQKIIFQAPNLYSINEPGTTCLINGQQKPSLKIWMSLVKLTDNNPIYETGRKTDNSNGAREILGGGRVSYAVVPLENLDAKGNPTFVLPNSLGATFVFDPRLVALSVYPKDVADVAGSIKQDQSSILQRSVQAINSDYEYVPWDPNQYYSSVVTALTKEAPALFDLPTNVQDK